jgi:hypothetical protein
MAPCQFLPCVPDFDGHAVAPPVVMAPVAGINICPDARMLRCGLRSICDGVHPAPLVRETVNGGTPGVITDVLQSHTRGAAPAGILRDFNRKIAVAVVHRMKWLKRPAVKPSSSMTSAEAGATTIAQTTITTENLANRTIRSSIAACRICPRLSDTGLFHHSEYMAPRRCLRSDRDHLAYGAEHLRARCTLGPAKYYSGRSM